MNVKSPPKAADDVEAPLNELVRLVQPVFSALKSGGRVPEQLRDAFDECALGPRHLSVLVNVILGRELSVSELADHLHLSLSTTSLMVGELSRAGLLERSEDERDRRRTLVRVAEDHRGEIESWFDERIDPFRRTLQRLGPRARENFLEGWRILVEETEPIEPDGPGG